MRSTVPMTRSSTYVNGNRPSEPCHRLPQRSLARQSLTCLGRTAPRLKSLACVLPETESCSSQASSTIALTQIIKASRGMSPSTRQRLVFIPSYKMASSRKAELFLMNIWPRFCGAAKYSRGTELNLVPPFTISRTSWMRSGTSTRAIFSETLAYSPSS